MSDEPVHLLVPETVAVSPEGRLVLAYEQPPPGEDALAAWLDRLADSALWAVRSGQADSWGEGSRFAGYDVVVLADTDAPDLVAPRLETLALTLGEFDVRLFWRPRPAHRVVVLDQELADLLAPLGSGTLGVLLWASQVGTHREFGVHLVDPATGEPRELELPLPPDLGEHLGVHKDLYYAATGSPWRSLRLITHPDGRFQSVPSPEPLPWAGPFTDADWAGEAALYPPVSDARRSVQQ
ncbi:MAG TPA: hypothetical protein VFN73_01720 [Propionibacteriaceae bacterium]|nr:hypothetical protein [Propionibacteriaceae bacterium]